MKRTLNEILKEADDNRDCLKTIESCGQEIINNKYSFSLVQLKFANEFLTELVKEIARKDAKELKKI